ncbi:DUF6386 family protein [Pseudomonas sp. NUPR-001]|uniref:DUF6386 family protein n=1 Tax=Pseudomonas sp. NUPR-001 TaxID=3416058 RepID=UPI003F9E16CC
MNQGFSVVTDTATLVVFDLQAIQHRIDDTCDWWSIQVDELLEMNEGNIAFLNVGGDGRYQVKIQEDLLREFGGVYLKFPSGRVFIGAGEDATGGGLEPDGSDAIQGVFLDFEIGSYYMKYKVEGEAICLAFSPSTRSYNEFASPVRFTV